MAEARVVGIDIGTSGVRVAALSEAGEVLGLVSRSIAQAPRSPAFWWQAVGEAVGELGRRTNLSAVAGVCVDGTSGTMLGLDEEGEPVGAPIMYDEPAGDAAVLAAIEAAAPETSAARGASSALARAVVLGRRPGVSRVLHQADWLLGRLGAGFAVSDFNNALKTGFDPITAQWPDWIADVGVEIGRLPRVFAPGTPVAMVGEAARALGLPAGARLHVGTTDGCASFLATGASELGEGVSALGSTLTLKLLSDRPVFAPQYGIYSHRLAEKWLVGGASNTGGKAILSLFAESELPRLTAAMRPDRPTGFDYYPLAKPGERFPIADGSLPPRLTPRPDDEALFFQGVLEGIAAVEALGYRRLVELGAPPLVSVRSVGGGASNEPWSAIRQAKLGVPFLEARSQEACVGTALLALAQIGRPLVSP
ncbi:FGGY-family carbohydrate kinase [Aureimonas psammosilenae]|uniref:FGGY-family carbohydrate kinase n=1 Tax=Aureimonas psammosilenae TaxID=2495496 RepID=UPI001260B124|nr:FGGY-family carbohydrate kinase [Aureimonas psammosilenae]